jgi:nitronate monooxygenase
VLAAGAAGARIGTRFIASTESGAHPDYVSTVLAADDEDTEIIDGFDRCPLCATLPRARVLSSAVAAAPALRGCDAGTMPGPEGDIPVPSRPGMPPHRDVRVRIDAMPLCAGQSVGAVTSVAPAAEILAQLTTGAEELLSAR